MINKVIVSANINGNSVDFVAEPQQSLLECLRDTLGLTGSKEGCNDGNCGACSVLLNGNLTNACMVLAVEIEGQEVMTVEGMADLQELHPVQEAFVEEDGLQCGYCTPGFIVATKALLDKNPNPTDHEIRFWLAGNLCRCTGYDKIVRSVMAAAQLSIKKLDSTR